MWRPWKIDTPLARFGPAHDGGYVIPNTLFGAKAILGYGVDKDVTFENQLSSTFDVPAWVFDHTIDEIPPLGKNVTYVKEGITGIEEKDSLFNLKTHVDRYLGPEDNFVLKMDVEGAEWDVLRTSDLSRVTLLIMELHELESAPLELIEKLHETFYLVHIHSNNCHNQPVYWLDRVRRMPRYIECTWVRKDLVTCLGPSTDVYPTPLDVVNRGDAPDIKMNFWDPIQRPFTFVAPDDEQRRIMSKLACPEDEILYDLKTTPTHPNVMVFRSGDIVPIELIISLNTLEDDTKNVFVPVIYNGLMGMEPRIFMSGTKVYEFQKPIFCFPNTVRKDDSV